MPSRATKHQPFKSVTAPGILPAVRGGIPSPPQWPHFRGTSQFVGASPSGRVTVFVDPALGQPGLQNAQDLVNDADRVVTLNNALFASPGGPVSVIVYALDGATDGSKGADHLGCNYVTGAAIEVCASFGNSMRVSGLFEAELSECSMGGILCKVSTGEALSRWCAIVISKNALADFATAPIWMEDGMHDFVNRTDLTDRNSDSTGCGMAFLSWLMSKGRALDQIAQEMVSLDSSATLAQLYANLTGGSSGEAWPAFKTAIEALPGGVTSDDPFGAFQGDQITVHTIPRVALGSKVLNSILADLDDGKTSHEIVINVERILSEAPKAKKRRVAACECSPESRRLLPPRERSFGTISINK